VFSEVLANRLKNVLDKLIAGVKQPFIQHCQVFNGVLIAYKVVDEARGLKRETILFKELIVTYISNMQFVPQ